MVPHFVSRQIIVGAGKVGAETESGLEADPVLPTQLARRVLRRGRRTRDDAETSHHQHPRRTPRDAERFRRLHVIIGDANMSQVATFVKLGSTATAPRRARGRRRRRIPAPCRVTPCAPCGTSPSTRRCTHRGLCDDDRERTAWDYQDELWHLADATWSARVATPSPAPDEVATDPAPVARDARRRARRPRRRRRPRRLGGQAPHRRRLSAIVTISSPRDAQLRAIDLQYHDLRPDQSLAAAGGSADICTATTKFVKRFTIRPTTTRAYFRGQCVARYPDDIVSANWDSVVFDLGDGPLQRVPMMDPLRGTRELTEELLETSATADALLEALDR